MDLLKTAFNYASTAAQTYYANYSKQEKIRQILKTCTYSDETKTVIEIAAKKVCQVYDTFVVDVLQFGNKAIIKMKMGKGNVFLNQNVRGATHKVDFNMMIPPGFPKKAPFVRIINQNSQLKVDPFYHSLRSPNDNNSYILNEKLTQIKNWKQSSSIVNIISQSMNMFRQHLPFSYAPSSQNSNYSSNYNPNFSNNNPNFNSNPNNQNWNQMSHLFGVNQPSQGFNSYENGSGSYGFKQPVHNQHKPPIPFNMNNANDSIAKGQTFVHSSKQLLEKMKKEHVKSVQKIQTMEVIKYSLESQEDHLRHENIKIMNFIKKSENIHINDLSSLIRTRDEKSEQILDIISNIRAREDCLAILESKFNSDEIQFNEFIRLSRKIEQEKFEQKFLLLKCID